MTQARLKAVAGVAVALLGIGFAAPAGADPPAGQADCVAQFVSDFQNLFPGFTVGEVQGQLGVAIPGYVFPTGGQVHFLQPFGVVLRGQATAAHGACPYDLTP
jgi:hypothetical protein